MQDLILGFNTTQGEVQALADKLYLSLREEVQNTHECTRRQKQEKPSILGLHSIWIKECVKEEETVSFAFLLVRNVILISSTSMHSNSNSNINTKMNIEKHTVVTNESTPISIVEALKDMMQNLMDAWNDTGSFQQSWLKIMHLWIRCSFSFQQEDGFVHSAWAHVDAQGILFDNCFKCISSTFKIRMLLLKTGLVEYLMDILTKTSLVSADNSVGLTDHREEEGLFMCHVLSLLKTIVVNSSVWIFPYPTLNVTSTDADADRTGSPPTLETLKDEFHWIENVDEEMKTLSTQHTKHPSIEEIRYLLAPFCSLLEIALCQQATELDGDDSSLLHVKSASANLGKDLVHPYLIDTCEQCITHILCSSACDQDLFTNGSMISFLNTMKHTRATCCKRNSLPLAVIACYNIIANVTEYGLWKNDKWTKSVGTLISIELPYLIRLLPRRKVGGSFDSWNRLIGGILCPILKHHGAFSGELPISVLRKFLCDYGKSVLSFDTGSQDDLVPLIRMVSSSHRGRSILESMQSPSTLDAIPEI